MIPGAKVCSSSDILVIPVGIGTFAAKVAMGKILTTINKHKITAKVFDKIALFFIENLLFKNFI